MIYFVEDDRNIRDLVVYTLNSSGLEAHGCADDEEFRAACQNQRPSLVLLDVMLPGVDGTEILARMKSTPLLADVPVIMVTARSAEVDIVSSLDSGADDYITKPFGMMELVSRVRAVLRRTGQETYSDEITVGPLTMNLARHIVTVDGQEVSLTLKEYQLLEKLLVNADILLTRDQLLDDVWEYSYHGKTRTLDMHILSLRKKLGSAAELIKTIRGVGYKLSL